MKKHLVHLTDNLLYSYSTLLFMRSRFVGVLLFLTTLLNPNLAVSGIISWMTTLLFAYFIGIRRDELVHTVYTYNSLIVGFSIGYLFKISFLSILLTIGTSVLTVLLSYSLLSLATAYLKLPVLNIPFFIVSTVIYLASVRYSALFVDSFYAFEHLNLISLPTWLQGLLRSTGILLFLPYDLPGMIILIALALFSRIAFFLTIASYYLGVTALALLKGNSATVLLDFSAFNFILIGIALGGVFLIPSKRSYVLAMTAVFVAVFIMDAISVVWSTFGIPVFTLPFNFVVLLFLYVLNQIGFPYVNLAIQEAPEKSLSNYLNFTQRFDYKTPQPFLPFLGQWTVYQSFDDQWTHRGPWKYAYDFVMTDDNQETFCNGGLALSDYYCFGKPVLAPIAGTVVDAGDALVDNPIGEVDKINNWGNYIIIYSPFGYYVEISHLRQKSLQVGIGAVVSPGTVLGYCGNSGNSPQPHIHMQIQYWAKLGSETFPYYFSNAMDQDKSLLGETPLNARAMVEPVIYSRKLAKIMTFILDDRLIYQHQVNGKTIGQIQISIKMAETGCYYFHLAESSDKLYFGTENNRFVFYSFEGRPASPLTYFFAALPKSPLCMDKNVNWEEVLPDNLLFRVSKSILFLKSFNHKAHRITGRYRFISESEIQGEITNTHRQAVSRVMLDRDKGFKQVEISSAGVTHTLLKIEAAQDVMSQ